MMATELDTLWRYRHISAMLQAYRRAFAVTAAGGRVQMSWAGEPLDAAGFRREFMTALHRRINAKAGADQPRGRKDTPEWFAAASRDARAVYGRLARRVIVRQFETAEARRRFARLLSVDD